VQPGTGPTQYANGTWEIVLGSTFLLVGMLAVIPVGLTLRELLGRGAGPELMGAWPKAWPGSSLRCGSSRTAGRSRSTKAGASAAQAFN
jgi:hypothetical protein